MSEDAIRVFAPAETTDAEETFGKMLALNNAYARDLTWLEPDRLRGLLGQAFMIATVGDVHALVLTFDQSAAYDSEHFLWFRARYDRFVYVDRIVVAASARGRGHARRLYAHLFEHALRAGQDRIVCEVNTEPANPTSDAFHAALGFEVVGAAGTRDGRKTVRYFSRILRA